MASDPRRVNDLVGAARDQPDPAARQAFLDRECGADTVLRSRVEVLLTAIDAPETTLQQALAPGALEITGDFSATRDTSPAEQVGAIVAGKYKLLQVIGEGGLGSVFMADQLHPVKRRVAVKVLKPGMDTARVLARFETERQALALMNHPNIAKVLDAGTTDGAAAGASVGRPFVVMELVKGVPITQFCDDHMLSVPERLSVFMQVCSAVQHAHQKGIIHRDLKPWNILVELHDGKPAPKVIDFGMAKPTGGMQLTEQTLFTDFGSVAGTPLYMAPEQATFNALDVDTRADIYALGVILYELLAGTTPIERDALKRAAFDEVLRVIRELDPPTPSSRISNSESKASVAAARRMEPAKLAWFVRGELDWIVMKALAKERERRYESATGLARDVERFLTNEPVQAGPPGAGYKLRKFVRRNRGSVVAAAAVLAAVLTGAGIAAWQAVRADQARQRESQRAEGERQAKETAEKRLTQVEKANVILGAFFRNLNPRDAEGDGKPLLAKLGEQLDQATAQMEGEAIGDPLTVARMQLVLGEAQLGLGSWEKAADLFAKSRARFTELLGPEHPDTLTSMNNLADTWFHSGKLDLSLPLFDETLKLRKIKLGPDHPDTLTSMNNLAENYRVAGKLELALPLYKETLRVRRATLGPEHLDTLFSMNNLALCYKVDGKLDLALPLYEETFLLQKSKLGPSHDDTLTSMNNLAMAYLAARKLDLALPLIEETLKLVKARVGSDHPNTLTSMNNLAECYLALNRLDLALPLFEETLKLRKVKIGPDHPRTLGSMHNLATGYQAVGKLDLGLPLFEETLKLRRAKLGPDHPQTLVTLNSLALALLVAGRSAEALPYFDQLLAERRKRDGADSPEFATLLAQVSTELLKVGQFAAAETYLRECLGICERKEPRAWTTFNVKALLGDSLLGQKKYADAEPPLLAGYEGLKQQAAKIPKEGQESLTDTARRLVRLYEAGDKPAEAEKWRKELYELTKAAVNAPFTEPPKP